jgi:1,2-diacylglycerol 3-beta-glucosyltransferase
VRRLAVSARAGAELWLAACHAYLLTLLLAAAVARREETGDQAAGALRLIALVPAHDEQADVAGAVCSLLAARRSGELRVIVIADNCTDATAERAGAAGAEVWTRTDPTRRGKGFALQWALARLLAEDGFDAVVVLDADCRASANMLAAIERRLAAGAQAVQVDYVVSNPGASAASALRHAAFALGNTVRYLGKDRLGLSCGLAGTGMAFSRALLADTGWPATGLAEDAEYHLEIVRRGAKAVFAGEASVTSPMPMRLGSAGEERWEQGRLSLVRGWSARLVLEGMRLRDPVRLHAGLEWLVPPQALLALLSVATLTARLAGGRRALPALAALAAQGAFVLGGLRLAAAPREDYRALALAPALVARKALMYTRLLAGRGPTTWIRSERA